MNICFQSEANECVSVLTVSGLRLAEAKSFLQLQDSFYSKGVLFCPSWQWECSYEEVSGYLVCSCRQTCPAGEQLSLQKLGKSQPSSDAQIKGITFHWQQKGNGKMKGNKSKDEGKGEIPGMWRRCK